MALPRTPVRTEQPVPATADPAWATEAADTVIKLVETVRDRTTKPVDKVLRGVVFGVLALLVAPVLAVVTGVVVHRAITLVAGHRAWVADLLFGLVMWIVGAWLWRRRRPREQA